MAMEVETYDYQALECGCATIFLREVPRKAYCLLHGPTLVSGPVTFAQRLRMPVTSAREVTEDAQ
jgi:hypothetical protein